MKRTVCILLSLVLALTGLASLCVTAHATYNVGDTFMFGSYPQTKVNNTATIAALNNLAKNKEWSYLGFYSGNKDFNNCVSLDATATYCDVTYDSVKYRGVKFTAYRPNDTTVLNSTNANPGQLFYQYTNGYSINTRAEPGNGAGCVHERDRRAAVQQLLRSTGRARAELL